MKKSRFTDSQIIEAIKRVEAEPAPHIATRSASTNAPLSGIAAQSTIHLYVHDDRLDVTTPFDHGFGRPGDTSLLT